MEEKNNNQNDDLELDFAMFIDDEGAHMLSTEQLNEIKKKLPKWDIEPPSKYRK